MNLQSRSSLIPLVPPPRNPVQTSLKWFLLVFAALLPVGSLAMYSYVVAAQSVRKLVSENNESAARITAVLLDRELERSISFAQTLAALPGTIEMVQDHDVDAVRARLKAVVESSAGLDRASMSGVDGQMWSDYPLAPETLGKNISDREWFVGVAKEWKPFVSGVYKRLSDTRPLVVVVATSVKHEGVPIGVMAFHYRLEGMTEWLRTINVGDNGHIVVIDPKGLVAVHPELDMQAREYNEYASLDAVQQALKGYGQNARYVDPFTKQNMVASLAPVMVAGQRWVVISHQPEVEAYAPIRSLQFQIFVAAMIVALLGLAVVIALGKISSHMRRMNAALSIQNHKLTQLAHIVQSSNDAILSTTLDGVITSWNPGAERIYGYPAEEAIGQSVGILCPPELQRNLGELLARVGRGERIVGHEVPRIAKGNRPVIVSISIAPLTSEEGNIEGTTSVTRDVTEQRRAEEELAQKAKELARSNSELEQFAYVASHDLREPLRMINSYSQLLSKRAGQKLDDDEKTFLGHITDGAERMKNLINDLLEYSRLNTRGKPFAAVDCNEVLIVAKQNLTVALEESGVTLEVEPLPVVSGDFTQLSRLFQNLIDNALKFKSARAPHIRILAIKEDAGWHFAVQDNGIGIDPQHFKRIFAIFQRLHTREEYPGTGIGLSICKRIVERHGGNIWVESKPGEGSTFHFILKEAETKPA